MNPAAQPLARDKNGQAIEEGDVLRGPNIEGIVFGVQRGMILIAVKGYGSYGLWPQNAELVLDTDGNGG